MKLKRLVSVLLAGIIALPVLPSYAREEQYTEAAERLYGLGLLDELPNDEALSETLTRGEAVKYIMPFMGIDAGEKGVDTDFSDVERNNPYSQYVQQAHQTDLIHGYEDGTFRPDEPVSYAAALSIFVNALGYKDIAATYGSYPNGVTAVAKNLKFTLSGGYSENSTITAGDFLSIMDMAKDADYAEALGKEFKVSYDKKDSILSKLHGIYYGEAVMTANEYSALSEDLYLGEGRVMLGNERFAIGERAGAVGELLGCRVEYYYREDSSENVLLWARSVRKCEIVTVSSENIVSYADGVYTYYKTPGSSRTTRAALSGNADVIYNGRVNLHMQASQWKPGHGEIILIDNDGDKEYDVVKITDFRTMLVGGAFSESRSLRDKYTKQDLSFKDESVYDVICIKDGKNIAFSQIKENDALNIAVSSGANSKVLVTIYVSDTVVSGTVSSVDVRENEADIIIIDDTEYKLTPYAELNADIRINDTANFYLDHLGYVAGSVNGIKTGLQYGYLMKTQYNSDEEILTLKILTTEGRIMFYDLSEKAKTNGVAETAQNVFETLRVGINGKTYQKPVGQPIKYALNSAGEINKLITHEKSGGGDSSVQKDRIRVVSDDTGGTVYPATRNINMRYGYTEDAVVFRVPDVDSQVKGNVRDTDFTVEDVATWKHANGYNLQVFDDDDMGYCSLILRVDVFGSDTINREKDPYAMVDKVTTELNGDDEQIYVVHAWKGGALIQLTVEAYTALIDIPSCDKLKKGSIVEYNLLDNGITGCMKLITEPDNFTPADTYDGNRSRENVYVRGQVQKNNGNTLIISYEKENGEYKHTSDNLWLVPVTGGYIHVYDRDDNEIKTVSSLSDIKDYEHYGNQASLVMCQMTYMKVSNVFVIN